MKKLISILAMMLCLAIPTQAQNVYKEVLRLAKEQRKPTNRLNEQRETAKFSVDALEYMAAKTKELMPDSTTLTLDYQSYCLHEFIRYYKTALNKASNKASRRNVVMTFQEATLKNRRFNDKEEDITFAYIKDNKSFTPFCIDTDWVKAMEYLKNKGYYYE